MSEREWRFYLDDMIGFAERIIVYTEGFDQATFAASGITYDATIRNLELLGEAATHIPPEIRDGSPSIQWRQVIATRNRFPWLPGHRQRHPLEHHKTGYTRSPSATP